MYLRAVARKARVFLDCVRTFVRAKPMVRLFLGITQSLTRRRGLGEGKQQAYHEKGMFLEVNRWPSLFLKGSAETADFSAGWVRLWVWALPKKVRFKHNLSGSKVFCQRMELSLSYPLLDRDEISSLRAVLKLRPLCTLLIILFKLVYALKYPKLQISLSTWKLQTEEKTVISFELRACLNQVLKVLLHYQAV